MLATTFSCPDCGAVLKLANPVPAGKKIKCPKCNTVFPAPAGDPPPSAVRPSEDAGVPARTKPGRQDAIRDDYEPVRSRGKAAGKPREEDYDRDDEEDREDEDVPRPRKKSKGKAAQKGGKGLMIGVIIGLVVLLLGGAACALWVWPGFLKSSLPAAPANVDLAAFLPENAEGVVGVDVATADSQLQSNFGLNLDQAVKLPKQILPQGLADALKLSEKAVFASEKGGEGLTIVLKTKERYKQDDMAKTFGITSKPVKDSGPVYYKMNVDTSILRGQGGMAGGQGGMAGARGMGGGQAGMAGARGMGGMAGARGMGGGQAGMAGARGMGGAQGMGGMGGARGMAGMGGAQGMGGGMAGMVGGMLPQWSLGMPNDRVLVMTRLPGNKLETLISSPDPKSKLSSQLATAVKNVQDAPVWFAQAISSTDREELLKKLPEVSKDMPVLKPLINPEGGGESPLKQIAALQGKITFPGNDVEVSLGTVFTDEISATRMRDGLKKILGQGKEILASLKAMPDMKKSLAQLEGDVNELLSKLDPKAAGTVCEVSIKFSKAQIDKVKALATAGQPK
jgi:hypothetical protein